MSDMEANAGAEAPVVDDVHSDVRAAMESLSQTQEDAAVADDAPKERSRDESGRFAKAEGADTGDTQQEVSDADPLKDKPEERSPAFEPPKGWSADAKAKWSALDPSIQAEIAKREQDMDTGGQRWSEEKRRYEETLSPMRDFARMNGINEQEAITRFLNADRFLSSNPVEAIKWLAQSYGVDLENMTATQRPQQDPMVAQLRQELSTIRETLTQREVSEVQSQIDAFAKAPGHEHFSEAKTLMGHLINSGQAADMQEAYEKAIWAIPTIREKLIAAQTAEAQAKARAQSQVDKAKRGAISVNGSPVTAVAPTPGREFNTVEEAARAAWAQHMGA